MIRWSSRAKIWGQAGRIFQANGTSNAKILRQDESPSFLPAGVILLPSLCSGESPFTEESHNKYLSIWPSCLNTSQCLIRKPWSIGLFTKKGHRRYNPRWGWIFLASFFFFFQFCTNYGFLFQQPSLVWAQTPRQNFLSYRNEQTGVTEFFLLLASRFLSLK